MVNVNCASCETKACCQYRGWKVFFLAEDRDAVARIYGEEKASQIKEFYGRQNGQPVYAVTLPCPFFDSASGQCNVYQARPLVCRVFPIEIEPITGAYYVDQAVCPERNNVVFNPDIVQIDVKEWCAKFWQSSAKEKPTQKPPIQDDGPNHP